MGNRLHILLHLLRVLFPRWAFFDQVGHHFELEFKARDASSWERVSFQQERRLLGVLLNPNCNLALAQVSLLEQFAFELQTFGDVVDLNDVEALTSYQLVKDLLRVKLKEYGLQTTSIQFKIVASRNGQDEDLFISHWIALGAA